VVTQAGRLAYDRRANLVVDHIREHLAGELTLAGPTYTHASARPA
jgi:hypothetical protein